MSSLIDFFQEYPVEGLLLLSYSLLVLYLSYVVWRSPSTLFIKLLKTTTLLIPILGPIFYGLAFPRAQVQPMHSQNRSDETSNLWGWGRYSFEQKNIHELHMKFLKENKARKSEAKKEREKK